MTIGGGEVGSDSLSGEVNDAGLLGHREATADHWSGDPFKLDAHVIGAEGPAGCRKSSDGCVDLGFDLTASTRVGPSDPCHLGCGHLVALAKAGVLLDGVPIATATGGELKT